MSIEEKKRGESNPLIYREFPTFFNKRVENVENIKFLDPIWLEIYSTKQTNNPIDFLDDNYDYKDHTNQDIFYHDLKENYHNDLSELKRSLNINIPEPNNPPLYSVYKKNGQECGTCCYRNCENVGKVINYREGKHGTKSGQCYCKYDNHIEDCKTELLSLYEQYKDMHENLDHYLENNIIFDIYKIKTQIERDLKSSGRGRDAYPIIEHNIKILYDYRKRCINDETIYLLRELFGRIQYTRKCFDPEKPHCLVDWGHTTRIVILQSYVEKIDYMLKYIDSLMLNNILKLPNKPLEKKKKKDDSIVKKMGRKVKKIANKKKSITKKKKSITKKEKK